MVDERSPESSAPQRAVDRIVGLVDWLWLALVGVILLGVGLRSFFGISRIELEELQWHLYAAGFLAGIVACVRHDRHVRVDVFRERMPARRRHWVDLYGLLLFQLPFLALILWSAVPLVAESFATAERSTSAGGLPGRWIFKSMLPAATGLLLVASAGQLRRALRALFDSQPGAPTDGEAQPRARGEAPR